MVRISARIHPEGSEILELPAIRQPIPIAILVALEKRQINLLHLTSVRRRHGIERLGWIFQVNRLAIQENIRTIICERLRTQLKNIAGDSQGSNLALTRHLQDKGVWRVEVR